MEMQIVQCGELGEWNGLDCSVSPNSCHLDPENGT